MLIHRSAEWLPTVLPALQNPLINQFIAARIRNDGWSPKTAKNYENFLARLRCHLRRFDVAGVNYRKLD